MLTHQLAGMETVAHTAHVLKSSQVTPQMIYTLPLALFFINTFQQIPPPLPPTTRGFDRLVRIALTFANGYPGYDGVTGWRLLPYSF